MSRFFSNSLILAVFCACFYLLTSCINWLASGSQNEIVREHSFDRRKADQFWHQRRWPDAALYYKNLTELDPYNGNAWFYLAECYRNQRSEFVRNVFQAERRSRERGERGESFDEDRIDENMEKARGLGSEAIENYKIAVGFPRFANRSRYSIARILAFQGDKEQAIEYLREAVENSYSCAVRGGLKNVYELQNLRGVDGFAEVCIAERENYERKLRGR